MVSTLPCFDTQRRILKYMYGDLLQAKDKDYCGRNIRIPTRHIWNIACLFKDQQGNISPKDDASIDREWEKTFEYNRKKHLKGVGVEEEVLIHESRLREFYISAIFSLLDIPKKPAEKTLLKLHHEDRNDELLRYRVVKRAGIYLPQTTYKLLFKRLSAKNIVRIFKYILLERQLIFFSSHEEEIPYITEAFLSLISPL